MSRKQRKQKQQQGRKRVVYKTPGNECQHADKGACPACMMGPRYHVRFDSRKQMPTAR